MSEQSLQTRRRRRAWLFVAISLTAVIVPGTVAAYVGPGAGVALATTAFAFVSTVFIALFGVLFWPARWGWRMMRQERRERSPSIKRAVIIGFDGIDPRRVGRLIDEGRLPNMKRLCDRGTMGELATTFPAMSPVAWSSFSTGVNPGKHGIFDFLTRDPKSYAPHLSSADVRPSKRSLKIGKIQIPLSKPNVRLLRRSRPFWSVLANYGVPASILRVPITFPPDRFEGSMLSAMCVPDLQGTQGTFTHIVADARVNAEERERAEEDPYAVGTTIVATAVGEGKFVTELTGPPDPFDTEQRTMTTTLEIERISDDRARVTLPTGTIELTLGEYSEWTTVGFKTSLGISMSGIARLRLLGTDPLALYVSPINIDPSHPMLPISHPGFFATFLSKLVGRYATLGFAEDTWALNEGVLDDEAFMEQAWLNHDERDAMLGEMLKRTKKGLVTCVFDGSDRVQHMMYRHSDPGHPALHGEEPQPDAIDACYERCDETLRKVFEEVDVDDPQNLVIVMSDHGFESFRRGVNLNVWLRDHGYLALDEDAAVGPWYRGVDWDRTQAFALGLGGIFLNIRGREARGIVDPDEASALAQKIATELEQLVDPDTGAAPIQKVYLADDVYDGPYTDDAPALIVGYAAGYRASWDGARGICDGPVTEDNVKAWSGDHCIDPTLVPGVIMTNQPLDLDGAAIIDVAPTVLDLFGIDAPRYMDGASLVAAEVGK